MNAANNAVNQFMGMQDLMLRNQVATTVFRKATDLAGQSALQLIEAATQPRAPAQDADARVGTRLDVRV